MLSYSEIKQKCGGKKGCKGPAVSWREFRPGMASGGFGPWVLGLCSSCRRLFGPPGELSGMLKKEITSKEYDVLHVMEK